MTSRAKFRVALAGMLGLTLLISGCHYHYGHGDHGYYAGHGHGHYYYGGHGGYKYTHKHGHY